jgi:hypothetical protein
MVCCQLVSASTCLVRYRIVLVAARFIGLLSWVHQLAPSSAAADLLSFIRVEALDRLAKQTGSTIASDRICWVLTVPAIWDDAAKIFMRHAALKAVRCCCWC